MLRIAIIIGSTRPRSQRRGRGQMGLRGRSKSVATPSSELVDIKDFNLPLLDEPVPP